MSLADSRNFPRENVHFTSNNRSAEELKLALDWVVGRIVVDNYYELDMLDGLAKEQGYIPDILLRIAPGIDPHTHKFIATGIIDSKFGLLLSSAEKAVDQAVASPHL